MQTLAEMRYNDDFIRANRICTWEAEIRILKERAKKPRQYPNPTDRIKYLEELIATEKVRLNE